MIYLFLITNALSILIIYTYNFIEKEINLYYVFYQLSDYTIKSNKINK